MTGSPAALETCTESALAKDVLTVVLCGVPSSRIVIVNP